jgi:hypothetical protein
MLKGLIKTFLRQLAPHTFLSLMSWRSNRQAQRVMDQHGVPAITAAFVNRNGTRVVGGPFAGMAYVTRSAGSSFLPKLVGSYERELHPALERILKVSYDSVIDVGCAEGYYAVGLALHLPGSPRVYAFDLDPSARRMCRDLSEKNHVPEQVTIGGFCDAARLQGLIGTRTLVVSDCEGFEIELLDPGRAPALRTAEIVVELHEIQKPGTTATLLKRFEATHHVHLVDTEDRKSTDYPVLEFLSETERAVALSEFRNGPMQWAILIPKN